MHQKMSVGPKIERELAGDVVSDHRFVHVYRAFRLPGCAAREMQQGHIVGKA